MPVRRILQLGDPMLRQMSLPVTSFGEAAGVVADLRDTLHEFRRTHGFGRGISAVQIGEPLRIIYIELEGVPLSIFNPVLESMSEERIRLWDNCFSFPDLLVHVERSASVALRYLEPGWNAGHASCFGRSLRAVAARNGSPRRSLGHRPGY